uniref:5' nucleotidase n=1 Tax=viral metagenome TaxID=1070528 RepID=A0A6M3JVC9_9ZZZZ
MNFNEITQTIECPYKLEPRKPRFLLDIDGVVVKYDFVGLVKRYFGIDIEPKAIFAYNLADVLGVSSKEIDDMFQEQVWGKPVFIDNALDTLNEISKIYEIIIYSNRIKYMGEFELVKWLIDNQIPFEGVDYGQSEYDFHVDDRPEKLEDTNSSIKLLYTQPWNVGCLNVKNNLIRVNNWQEVIEYVQSYI